MRRKLLIGTTALVAFVLLAAALLLWRIGDVVALYKPTLESKLQEALNADVRIGDLKLSLLPPAIGAYQVSIGDRDVGISVAALEARAELLPLLSRQLSITALTVRNPKIVLVQTENGINPKGVRPRGSPPQPGSPVDAGAKRATSSSDIALAVKEISVREGSVRIENSKTVQVASVDHLSLDSQVSVSPDTVKVPRAEISFDYLVGGTRGSAKAALDLSGKPTDLLVQVARFDLLHNGVPVSATASARIVPGEVSVKSLALRAFGGSISTSGDLRTNPSPQVLSVTLKGSNTSLTEILNTVAPGRPVPVRGTISSVSGELRSINLDSPVTTAAGNGALELRDGVVEGLNLPHELVSALSDVPFVGEKLRGRIPAEFTRVLEDRNTTVKQLTIAFRLSAGVVRIESLRMLSDICTLESTGTYTMGSKELVLPSNLALEPAISRALIAKVPELKGLVGADDRLSVPLTVKGTIPGVVILPDVAQITRKTSSGILDSVLKGEKKGLAGKLNKFLGLK